MFIVNIFIAFLTRSFSLCLHFCNVSWNLFSFIFSLLNTARCSTNDKAFYFYCSLTATINRELNLLNLCFRQLHTFIMRIFAISVFLFFNIALNGQRFFRTPAGEKFHQEKCHTIQNSEKIKVNQDDIIKFHLEPCKICKPIIVEPVNVSKICRGKTKKGEQCKLHTKDPSGYCHHHKDQGL